MARPRHDLIDITVVHLVEDVGTACRKRSTKQRKEDGSESGPSVGSDHHRGDRRDQEEFDDPRLRQLDIR